MSISSRFIQHASMALATAILCISTAHAQGSSAGDGLASLIPLLIIMVIFYFLLIRPQQKRLKTHQKLVDELRKGDKIVTDSGIHATIVDVKDHTLRLDIADNTRITIDREKVQRLAD